MIGQPFRGRCAAVHLPGSAAGAGESLRSLVHRRRWAHSSYFAAWLHAALCVAIATGACHRLAAPRGRQPAIPTASSQEWLDTESIHRPPMAFDRRCVAGGRGRATNRSDRHTRRCVHSTRPSARGCLHRAYDREWQWPANCRERFGGARCRPDERLRLAH
ncbi:hypothetical protein D3C72_1718460 [compost metagenome]